MREYKVLYAPEECDITQLKEILREDYGNEVVVQKLGKKRKNMVYKLHGKVTRGERTVRNSVAGHRPTNGI